MNVDVCRQCGGTHAMGQDCPHPGLSDELTRRLMQGPSVVIETVTHGYTERIHVYIDGRRLLPHEWTSYGCDPEANCRSRHYAWVAKMLVERAHREIDAK